VGAATMTVAASSDAACRKTCGGDLRVAVHIAAVLEYAPKDRSADYLSGANYHPGRRALRRRWRSHLLRRGLPILATRCCDDQPRPKLGRRWTAELDELLEGNTTLVLK
jgi:hypothetical protein